MHLLDFCFASRSASFKHAPCLASTDDLIYQKIQTLYVRRNKASKKMDKINLSALHAVDNKNQQLQLDSALTPADTPVPGTPYSKKR